MDNEALRAEFASVSPDIRVHHAWALLKRQCPTAERRFNRLTKGLADLLAEVQQEFPDAAFYTAGGGFTLMLGPSHDERDRPQSHLVALTASHYLEVGDGDF